MSRLAAVGAVVLLVLAAAGAAAPAVVAVADARLTVSDVAVSPTTPVAGAPVTVSVTVGNGGGSPEAVAVSSVRLVDGDRTLASTTRPGSLSPGESLTVPLTRTFGAAGEYDLTLVVSGTDEDGDRVEVRRPLFVAVESAPPLVEFDDDARPVAGDTTRHQVVVSNPTADPMRNVVVRLSASNAAGVVDRRTVASLDAGAAATLNFSLRYARPGETTLDARVDYTTAAGTNATTTQERAVVVAALDDDVGVRVSAQPPEADVETQPQGQLGALLGGSAPSTGATRSDDDDSQPRTVAVTVSNFGNAPVSDVVVTPRVGDATLPRVPVEEPIPPGSEATVEVSLERAPAGAVTFDVDYAVADESGQASTTFDNRPGRGDVRVTGLNLSVAASEGDDGRVVVRLSGNAGNTGQRPVTGVVVAVGESDAVSPAYPQRDYFVGTVDGSEFAPFELTARVDAANATAIPVVVTYAVDGVARERTIQVPLDDAVRSREGRAAGIALSTLGAFGVVATAVVGAAVVVGVRRRRGRE